MSGVSAREMLARLESIDLIEETRPIVENTGYKIVAKVKEQLYETGTDKFGKQLNRYKNTAYANKKHKMNPKPGYGVPDQYLTGAQFQGMQIEVNGDSERTYSNVSYFKYNEKRYGSEAFDMNEQHKKEYRKETLYPRLRKRIKEVTKTR